MEGVAVSGNVFLSPLAKDNGCYVMLAVTRRVRIVTLTLEELFAGILLEEGLVDNWAGEVVDHQLQDRLDLLLGVAGVVCKGSILIKLVIQQNNMEHDCDIPKGHARGRDGRGTWRRRQPG